MCSLGSQWKRSAGLLGRISSSCSVDMVWMHCWSCFRHGFTLFTCKRWFTSDIAAAAQMLKHLLSWENLPGNNNNPYIQEISSCINHNTSMTEQWLLQARSRINNNHPFIFAYMTNRCSKFFSKLYTKPVMSTNIIWKQEWLPWL